MPQRDTVWLIWAESLSWTRLAYSECAIFDKSLSGHQFCQKRHSSVQRNERLSNLGIIRLSVSFLYKFMLEGSLRMSTRKIEQLAAFQNMVERGSRATW